MPMNRRFDLLATVFGLCGVFYFTDWMTDPEGKTSRVIISIGFLVLASIYFWLGRSGRSLGSLRWERADPVSWAFAAGVGIILASLVMMFLGE